MKFLIATFFAMTAALAAPALASETVEGAKKDFQAAKAEVSAQLDSLDKKIVELRKSAAEKSTAAKEKTLKEAEETRTKLRADFAKMEESASSNWSSFKKSVSQSLDKLNTKAQKALKE